MVELMSLFFFENFQFEKLNVKTRQPKQSTRLEYLESLPETELINTYTVDSGELVATILYVYTTRSPQF